VVLLIGVAASASAGKPASAQIAASASAKSLAKSGAVKILI